jgi:hypothetical protein
MNVRLTGIAMNRSRHSKISAPAWHALLAPLPIDVVPRRQPVAPPEILVTPQGSAIAGWEQLTIELSAGPAGLRHVMVVLDAIGQPISACDTVLYRCEVPRHNDAADPSSAIECDVEFCIESVGGRMEQDGTFYGTRWESVGVETAEESEQQIESTPSEPSAADVAGIKALVAEMMRRQPKTVSPDGFHRRDR